LQVCPAREADFITYTLPASLSTQGGAYGITRVTLGFYPGYLVAYMDCGESIVYVAVAAFTLGQMITSVTGASSNLEPIYWVVFLLSSLAVHAVGGLAFWWINRIVAVASLIIVLIYILGSVQYADFNEYALMDTPTEVVADRWFKGGGMEFMRILPLPCWFFVGVESINLACKDMIAPKQTVPAGYIGCVSTLFVTCFAVLFACCSQYPGVDVMKNELNPFNYGFARMFNITYRQATALSLPATYATASGFMFCFGRQLRAMGQSGLVSHVLGDTITGWTTPVYALVGGSLVALASCFLMHYSETVRRQVFNICMLCALASYGTQFASFVVLRTKYVTSIKREFVSPLGMFGAAWGCLVFFVVFISICGFQDNVIAIAAFIGFLLLVSVYYVCVASARQFFSEEEKDVMFKAYVLKSEWPCDACVYTFDWCSTPFFGRLRYCR
jgi:ethanolamine permease